MRTGLATLIAIGTLFTAAPAFASSALLPMASYGTTTPFVAHYTVGDRVRVVEGPLRARAEPGTAGAIRSIQKVGAQGMVFMGPSLRDGMVWWLIDYDDRTEGWSVENFIAIADIPDAKAAMVQKLQAQLASLLAAIQALKAQQ